MSPSADSDEEFTNKLNPDEGNATQPPMTDEDSEGNLEMRAADPDEPTEVALPLPDEARQESGDTPEENDTTSSLDTQSLGVY